MAKSLQILLFSRSLSLHRCVCVRAHMRVRNVAFPSSSGTFIVINHLQYSDRIRLGQSSNMITIIGLHSIYIYI